MPIEIQVGPPSITISQGRTFMVTDQRGEIDPHTDAGVYAIDTRFVSSYRLFINREPLVLVNSSQLSFYSARWYLTNPRLSTESGNVEANTMGLTLERTVEEGIHEDFDLANYTGKQIRVVLELVLRSDFADIFEVKARRFLPRGRMQTRWDEQGRSLRTSYTNQDFHRAVTYHFSTLSGSGKDMAPAAPRGKVYRPNPKRASANALGTHVPVGFANGRIFFEITLEPGQEWHACGELLLEHGQHLKKPVYGHRTPEQQTETLSELDELQAHWLEGCPQLLTPNDHVYRIYRQAIEDMGALRIYDLDVSAHEWVPAAGVPWFVTLFGRDSLIVSLQNMSVSTGFARGALKRLADHQATRRDDYRDAQPGKILHELRAGELAHFHAIPHTPYYGTADATILYLLVLSETYRWTGDINLLRQYRRVAQGCLDWIDRYGDLNGDGFQEYQTYSPLGYENVNWKDSGDSVVYADGRQVKQPKGTCELQGYVHDAKVRMAEIFQVLGEQARAQALLEQAETLKRRFQQVYWMEQEGCFAHGQDGHKQLITSIASNAGHCLWSGIAEQDQAERIARRLLQDDMWSGWGIRTLSSKNPAYNPYSYHLGSVWPHDNGIIAAGFKRYGLWEEANQVIRAIFDAARRFEAYRLPEIFAGLKRKGKADFPALYPPGANIPQAWASGCVFQMLQTILGLRADAPHQRLYVNPTLPQWLSDLQLQHLRIGPCTFTLHFWREGDRSRWEVLERTADQGTAQQDLIQVIDERESGSAHS